MNTRPSHLLFAATLTLLFASTSSAQSPKSIAAEIYRATGVQGGLGKSVV